MSSPGIDFTDAPAVAINASDAAVNRAQAPRTNGGMQLAAALSELAPEIKGLGARVIKEDAEVQGVAAKKRALELGGQDLASAVRDGKIEATQNPFFIQDYNEESAYVRSQKAISDLTIRSQEWAEKNDHVAFQKRFSEELGAIGEQYKDPDAAKGFMAAAAPAQQQAFAANTAQVAANIEKDRAASLSQMSTEAILGVQKEHAGAASPDQLQEGLAHLRDRYFATGGTQSEWAKLQYHAFTSAAYNSGDETLLDKLPADIKNLPGIADQISTDKYHIMQAHGAKLHQQAQDARDLITVDGQKIFTSAYEKYGSDLITGKVSFETLAKDNPGANPLALTSALNTAQAATADNQALALAKTRGATLGGGPGADKVLNAHREAATVGMSPELNNAIGLMVHNGEMSVEDGTSLINKAIETTKGRNQQSGQMFPTPGKGLNAATTSMYGSAQPYMDIRNAAEAQTTKTIQWINSSLKVEGKAFLPRGVAAELKAALISASSQWLTEHPGDFAGAAIQIKAARGRWLDTNLPRYMGTPK